jgi:hypothetical protein
VGFVNWSPGGKSLLIGNWNPETQEKNFHIIHCYFLDLETKNKTELAGSDGFYGPTMVA